MRQCTPFFLEFLTDHLKDVSHFRPGLTPQSAGPVGAHAHRQGSLGSSLFADALPRLIYLQNAAIDTAVSGNLVCSLPSSVTHLTCRASARDMYSAS